MTCGWAYYRRVTCRGEDAEVLRQRVKRDEHVNAA
jgi:hypothetical protein